MANTSIANRDLVANVTEDTETARGVPAPSSTPAAVGMLSGMAAGAVSGAIAGPPGMLAGALLGSAIGAVASIALDAQRDEDLLKDEELDRAIGVLDGNIGEAPPNQPGSTRGTFSMASMGVGKAGEGTPNEGPIQNVDRD